MKQFVSIIFLMVIPLLASFAQLGLNKAIVFETNSGADGEKLEIQFKKGKTFKDPTFAIWIEDMNGNYIETLYVTEYLATGIYRHAKLAEGRPLSRRGEAKRPSALPNWLHKRNDGSPLLPTPDKPVPDAVTGATPKNNFILKSVSVEKKPSHFRIMLEINQPFDYNNHWTKTSYPAEFDYSYSAQPALVYAIEINLDKKRSEYLFKLLGHSHYSGKDGKLYPDVSTITTALNIVQEAKVILK